MTTLWQDIRYGLRMLARCPGFSVTVIVILALGIGANTAVFSVVNAVLFCPLPYDEPERIVRIWEQNKSEGTGGLACSATNIAYWREHNTVFDHISCRQNFRACLTSLDKPRYVCGEAVSSCFFSVMGVRPALGRGFWSEDAVAGHEDVVVLGHALWRDQFGGDPQVVGKVLGLDNRDYTIIGVMGPEFADYETPFWVPAVVQPDGTDGGGGYARLKPGVTAEQAQANLAVLLEQLAPTDPVMIRGNTVVVRRLVDERLGGYRTQLYLLWGAAGLVLLVACANAACLFLGHANVREREIAVRAMLGARRTRLVRQLLAQGVVLSGMSTGLGVLVGSWTLRGLLWICPTYLPRIDEAHVDLSVLFVALGLVVLTGLVFSIVPAWRVSDLRLYQTTKTRGTGLLLRSQAGRLRGGLIVAQIAVALTLLMCVGMFVQSLRAMFKVDLGFDPENVVIASTDLPHMRYPEERQWHAFHEQLLERAKHLPDVRSAALASCGFQLVSGRGNLHFSIQGRPRQEDGGQPVACIQFVSPDFIRTLGMQIVKGRDFSEQDVRDGAKCILINEVLAKRYFSAVDPIGQCIDGLCDEGMTIIGVVKDVRDYGDPEPERNLIYTLISGDCYSIADLVVRTNGRCEPLIEGLRAQIAALDADLDVSIRPLETSLRHVSSDDRFIGLLLGLFGQIALVLAAVGLYGSIQYAVTQHTHEIGIRMALGATQASVAKKILRQGVRLILPGVGLGLLGGYAMSRFMTSLLYQAKPADPVMLIVVLATLFIAALVACYVPARRATRIDPMVALRCE